MIRLNLGSGNVPLEGYLNIDRSYSSPGDWSPELKRMCLSGEVFPLGEANGSVDLVRASHVLEHFSHRETLNVLREWVRVLAPGGVLKLAVPDFEKLAQSYLDGTDDPLLEAYLMGGHVDENDHHGAIFDHGKLAELMEMVGLVDIQPWESEGRDCSAYPISLNLQGRKPAPGEPTRELLEDAVVDVSSEALREIRIPAGAVKAVMTAPRLGFLDTQFCALQAFAPLGISLERIGGVFWYQSMAELFERHLADETRYLVTLDYDSLFTKEDVLELARLMETRPEADAIAALQSRREKDSPLFATAGGVWKDGGREVTFQRSELDADLFPVLTAHFGLTIIRVEALKDLPRPWFYGIPAADGSWGEGKSDPDIAFWTAWKSHGCSLFIAPRVVIGHLELMAAWPDEQMRTRHSHTSEWHETGKKPAWAWK